MRGSAGPPAKRIQIQCATLSTTRGKGHQGTAAFVRQCCCKQAAGLRGASARVSPRKRARHGLSEMSAHRPAGSFQFGQALAMVPAWEPYRGNLAQRRERRGLRSRTALVRVEPSRLGYTAAVGERGASLVVRHACIFCHLAARLYQAAACRAGWRTVPRKFCRRFSRRTKCRVVVCEPS